MEGREMEKASMALDPTGPLPVEPEWVDSEDQRSIVIVTNVSFGERRRETSIDSPFATGLIRYTNLYLFLLFFGPLSRVTRGINEIRTKNHRRFVDPQTKIVLVIIDRRLGNGISIGNRVSNLRFLFPFEKNLFCPSFWQFRRMKMMKWI